MHLRVVLLVHSYTLRVVGSGIKAQSSNPEVKVKVVDPVVNQIIDKLRHINQVRSCPFTDLSLSLSLARDSIPLFSQPDCLPARLCGFWLLSDLLMSQGDEISGIQAPFHSCNGCCTSAHVCRAGVPGGRLKARSPLLTLCWHPFPD